MITSCGLDMHATQGFHIFQLAFFCTDTVDACSFKAAFTHKHLNPPLGGQPPVAQLMPSMPHAKHAFNRLSPLPPLILPLLQCASPYMTRIHGAKPNPQHQPHSSPASSCLPLPCFLHSGATWRTAVGCSWCAGVQSASCSSPRWSPGADVGRWCGCWRTRCCA